MLDLVLHVLAELFIKRAKRLVHQHQFRLKHQCAGEGNPLLLTTGQLRRLAIGKVTHLHHVQRAADFLVDLAG